jgi:Fe-Mn family superoxide dismutase
MDDMARLIQETPVDATALNRLHGESLAGNGSMSPAMELALTASFGSVARWREAFVAMAQERAGACGWILLVFQPQGSLRNQWVAEDLETGLPLLVMPAPAPGNEHGAETRCQVQAFMDKLDWNAVHERYEKAVHEGSDAWGALHSELAGALLLDVRREAVFKAAATRMPGAQWLNPAEVDHWANSLPTDRKIIVYCVFGHEVSRATAMRLRAAGLNAQYLRGGIDGWQSAGLTVETNGTPP